MFASKPLPPLLRARSARPGCARLDPPWAGAPTNASRFGAVDCVGARPGCTRLQPPQKAAATSTQRRFVSAGVHARGAFPNVAALPVVHDAVDPALRVAVDAPAPPRRRAVVPREGARAASRARHRRRQPARPASRQLHDGGARRRALRADRRAHDRRSSLERWRRAQPCCAPGAYWRARSEC